MFRAICTSRPFKWLVNWTILKMKYKYVDNVDTGSKQVSCSLLSVTSTILLLLVLQTKSAHDVIFSALCCSSSPFLRL